MQGARRRCIPPRSSSQHSARHMTLSTPIGGWADVVNTHQPRAALALRLPQVACLVALGGGEQVVHHLLRGEHLGRLRQQGRVWHRSWQLSKRLGHSMAPTTSAGGSTWADCIEGGGSFF